MTLAQAVGRRIGILLKEQKMTHADLVSKTGIKRQSLYHYLSAATIPSAENLIKLADALDCTTDLILGRKEKR